MKQVDKTHYDFESYMTKRRWASMWHQLSEINKLEGSVILEVGPGPGVFKVNAIAMGYIVKTLDIDPELNPDYIGSAVNMPIADHEVDIVCAFQILEHLPYDDALKALKEMIRVCRSYVVISLPDAKTLWSYSLELPKLGPFSFRIPRPNIKGLQPHKFDGEHYWEINKKNYPLKKILKDISAVAKIINTFRPFENPDHRFFILKPLNL